MSLIFMGMCQLIVVIIMRYLVVSCGLCDYLEKTYIVTPFERFAINISLNFAPMVGIVILAILKDDS